MSRTWTKDQQEVIDTRKKNILVSAAAGSGKTAVLVERVIQKILDEENPVDVDRLLVVTFTNAAAGEMKERIQKALEDQMKKKLESGSGSVHIKKQLSYLQNAQITTIHSFCMHLIQNYFSLLDLDPAFRLADEGETKLLKADVVSQVLEECYQEGDEAFYKFVESMAPGKKDDNLEEWILQIYEISQSYPWPEEWLDMAGDNYNLQGEWEEKQWYQAVEHYVQLKILAIQADLNAAKAVAEAQAGPYMYLECIQDDLHHCEQFAQKTGYDARREWLGKLEFMPLSRKRDESVDPALREMAKTYRNRAKAAFEEIKKSYYIVSEQQMKEDAKRCHVVIRQLVKLVKRFATTFAQEKRNNGILDFNDLEHFALEILVNKTKDGWEPTQVAKEVSGVYEEIMVDEYQDSNLVQETIISGISGESDGRYNRFMVGDVKQSIYKFRMARPEIFIEKYESYQEKQEEEETAINKADAGVNANNRLISLKKNFRSRPEVLDFVNHVFYGIMTKSLGGIEYDDRNALYCGAGYPECPVEQDYTTELLLVEKQTDDEVLEETKSTQANKGKGKKNSEDGEGVKEGKLPRPEIHARVIGEKIKELMNPSKPFLVWDKDENIYRPIRYNDIVILMRSVSSWQNDMVAILRSMGIPAVCQSTDGYFDSVEVQTILDFLRIIDNPRQDIPLAGVLLSSIGKFCEEELAKWKIASSGKSMYQSMIEYGEHGQEEELRCKTREFMELLEKFRQKAVYLSIHQLLEAIYEETGYYYIMQASKDGMAKCENLNMLKEKAVAYEETVYQGLFHFVRYIEKLQKFEIDFGQAVLESENAVQIMSIHKSKGLEYPVVFLAALEKRVNQKDSQGKIVVDMDFGLATDSVDVERRKQRPTLAKKVIAQKIRYDNLGEELRVLYVALTRACEKLYLVGCNVEKEKFETEWDSQYVKSQRQVAFHVLASATSYLDWIGMAIAHGENVPVKLHYIKVSELVGQEVKRELDKMATKEMLVNWDSEMVYQEEIHNELLEVMEYAYPYRTNQTIPVKVSVSDLKKEGYEQELQKQIVYREKEPELPSFMEEKKGFSGAGRGTAYHRIFELFDYTRKPGKQEYQAMLEGLLEEGKIDKETKNVIKVQDFVDFANTSLGKRMKNAYENQCLYREQPFVLGIPASMVQQDYPAEETVLVQGIIDAFFEEDGELVIVDYKTDNVAKIEDLVSMYKVQLEYYQKAVEQITKKKVKEKIIYSVKFGAEIEV